MILQPIPYPAVVSDPGGGGNPSFVGSKTATFASTTTAQVISLTNLRDADNAIVALQEGDMVLVCYVQASSAAGVRTLAECIPAGFTAAHDEITPAFDIGTPTLAASYKFMGATPDSSLTAPAPDDTTFSVSLTIFAFRGVDQTTPIDVTPVIATGSNSGRPNPGSITPSTAGAWIVGCHGSAANVGKGAVHTNSGDYSVITNQFKSAYVFNNFDATSSIGIKTDWTSGAFDAAQLGGSTDTGCSWATVSLALRGAPL